MCRRIHCGARSAPTAEIKRKLSLPVVVFACVLFDMKILTFLRRSPLLLIAAGEIETQKVVTNVYGQNLKHPTDRERRRAVSDRERKRKRERSFKATEKKREMDRVQRIQRIPRTAAPHVF